MLNFSQPSDRPSVYHIIRSIFVIISLQIINILRDFFQVFLRVLSAFLLFFLIFNTWNIIIVRYLEREFWWIRGPALIQCRPPYIDICMYVFPIQDDIFSFCPLNSFRGLFSGFFSFLEFISSARFWMHAGAIHTTHACTFVHIISPLDHIFVTIMINLDFID